MRTTRRLPSLIDLPGTYRTCEALAEHLVHATGNRGELLYQLRIAQAQRRQALPLHLRVQPAAPCSRRLPPGVSLRRETGEVIYGGEIVGLLERGASGYVARLRGLTRPLPSSTRYGALWLLVEALRWRQTQDAARTPYEGSAARAPYEGRGPHVVAA